MAAAVRVRPPKDKFWIWFSVLRVKLLFFKFDNAHSFAILMKVCKTDD